MEMSGLEADAGQARARLEQLLASGDAARTLEAFHRVDVAELARQLRVPTLVLHARGDARVPFEEGLRLAALIPGARFVALESDNHVLLDTGSYGLRLLASALDTSLALPAVPTPSGADAAECGKFISGYTWGAVRQADVVAERIASFVLGAARQTVVDWRRNGRRRDRLLEAFPLDGLDMMGTLGAEGALVGLIMDPERVIHRVVVGNYMGQNDGRITAVYEDKIELAELVPDGAGGWIERRAEVALDDE